MFGWDDGRHRGWAGWCEDNPHLISLAAGAFAGTTSETLLFPLDCLKTRLQSRRGFYQSGGFKGVYKGVGTAICAAAPASAIFFSTYEASKRTLAPYDCTNSVLGFCGIGLISSILGELAAGVYRVPMDLVKQRQQAGHFRNFADIAQGVRSTHGSVFFASYIASFTRDIMHSSLQFPSYEYLKLVLARWNRLGPDEGLPTWQAASCGSVAGVVSAALTTPLDLLRTRLNLRGSSPTDGEGAARPGAQMSALALVREEVTFVYRERGLRGFFAGGTCRAAWMGFGGFIFLGSFEWAKKHLLPSHGPQTRPEVHADGAGQAAGAGAAPAAAVSAAVAPPAGLGASVVAPEGTAEEQNGSGRQLGPEPPAAVSLTAGLLAGVAVDVPLHPLDTIKTRMQASSGFHAAGGFRQLWSGLSAVLVVSVPGSSFFFVVYECARHFLERRVPQVLQDEKYAIGRDAVAASVADVSACVVRVPCEILKQRMQAIGPGMAPLTFRETVKRVSQEGIRGFYAGFGATAMREVPFALIQMPLFEEIKHRHPSTAQAREAGDTARLGLIGMQAGCLAGSFAGVVTTPLDTAKTRIILTENRADRRGLVETMSLIRAECGVQGLFKGMAPRALHCGLGGALWLGAFEWSKLLIWGA